MSEAPGAWTRRALVGVLAFGVLARVLYLLLPASLWTDEAMLSLNIAGRSWLELLRPLDYAQVAPVPFLWAERAMILGFGVGEYALRLLPALAGIGALLVIWRLATRLLDPLGVLVATFVAATSSLLIYHSGSAKPYAVDALVGGLLFWVGLDLVRGLGSQVGEKASRVRWLRLGVLGVLGVLVSFPAVFVLAGVGVAGLIATPMSARRRLLPRLVACGAAWVGAFVILQVLLYQSASDDSYLKQFWNVALLVPGSPLWGARLLDSLSEVLSLVAPIASIPSFRYLSILVPQLQTLDTVAPGIALAGVGLAAFGAWRIHRSATGEERRGLAIVAMLVTPIAVAYGASFMGRFPIGARLLLFYAPMLSLLVGAGVAGVVHRASQDWWWRWTQPVFAGLGLLFVMDAGVVTVSPRAEEIRPLIRDLEAGWRPGDAVYVFHRAVAAWAFYTTDWRAPDRERLARFARLAGPDGPAHMNGPSEGVRPRGEGKELVFPWRGGYELVGVFTGIMQPAPLAYRVLQVPVRPVPDIGWTPNEGDRIARYRRVWMLRVHNDHGISWYALRRTAEARGGRALEMEVRPTAMLTLYEFPPAGTGSP